MVRVWFCFLKWFFIMNFMVVLRFRFDFGGEFSVGMSLGVNFVGEWFFVGCEVVFCCCLE